MTRITPEILLEAYRQGIFPMAESRDADDLFWVEPKTRGILPLDNFLISKSLARTIRKNKFRVTIDTAFARVIRLCGSKIAGRVETWINEEIIELYTALYRERIAHSIEVWHLGQLVGGLYGLALGGVFFGESKFHLERDASKVALAYTVARLKEGGFRLFDIQFLTEHLARFGAIEISRDPYKKLLAEALEVAADFYRMPPEPDGPAILQSIAQTS
ncbi:MAG TPA: leucyl/phenylalanyl-tRNA--protein transferase [Sphingomonadales bacterium]|nr:leucyl/phenylalanyl-tRNA--protein transferase [Sphingomonadales bacterium]